MYDSTSKQFPMKKSIRYTLLLLVVCALSLFHPAVRQALKDLVSGQTALSGSDQYIGALDAHFSVDNGGGGWR